MKTQNIEIVTGRVAELLGDNLKMRICLTNVDLRHIVERLLPMISNNEKKTEIVRDFVELLSTLSCSIDLIAPFPVGESYDFGAGRTTTFNGKKYYGGKVNLSE